MVPLAKAADYNRKWRRSVQIKKFISLVAISLEVIRKAAVTWPYYSSCQLILNAILLLTCIQFR